MEIPAPIPDSLLQRPCRVVGAGKTVDSLAKGYVKNTVCVGKYEAVIGALEDYNDKTKTDIKNLSQKNVAKDQK